MCDTQAVWPKILLVQLISIPSPVWLHSTVFSFERLLCRNDPFQRPGEYSLSQDNIIHSFSSLGVLLLIMKEFGRVTDY